MSRLLRLACLLPLLALVLRAQVGEPINDSTIDYYSSFDKDIYALVTGTADIYVGIALSLVNKMAVALLVVVLATAAWESISHQHILNLDYIARKFVVPYMFTIYILRYWITPIPGLGISFVGMFTNTAAELAAHAHLTAMDILWDHLMTIRDQIGPWSMITGAVNMVAWGAITVMMIFVKAAVFIVVATGVLGVGVGACIGPIFAIFYLFPPLRSKWFSWVEAMIKYSLYRTIGNLVISVWCTFLVGFLDNTFHGKYDLVHLISNAVSLFAVMLAFVFGIFKVPSLTSDFNSGSSGGGHGLMAGTLAFARGIFL